MDIREAAELGDFDDDADGHATLGSIVHDASGLLNSHSSLEDKTMVLVCHTGRRARLAAASILQQAPREKNVAVLHRGWVGWQHPYTAVDPDFLVVLGLHDSPEKLSLGLAALASAVDTNDSRHATTTTTTTAVLVLMSDGVDWFVKEDCKSPTAQLTTGTIPNVNTVNHGSPFKPCQAMLNKFLDKGGIVLACTTCVKHRQYSFEDDMMDCVHPMQMPDLVRMLGEVGTKGGSLQFL